MFDHLRLDKIPTKYILRRYTEDAVSDPDYNRKDYKTTDEKGTSLEYKRIILYSEAMKTVNNGCSSDDNFEMALAALKDVNSRMRSGGQDYNNDRGETAVPDIEAVLCDDFTVSEDARPYDDIKAPPVARTKGSRNKGGKGTFPAPAAAPARPEPELDENGKPKGQRLCSICNKIAGHNARTCKRKQLEKQLLETHQKVYGTLNNTDKVKKCIKELLSKQDNSEDDEDDLDTEEEEDYEDNEDEDQYDQQEFDDMKTDTTSGTDDEPDEESEEPDMTPSQQTPQKEVVIPKGQRECGLCHERAGHYASTCPKRLEILQKQIDESREGGSNKMAPKGKHTCGDCGKIEGHNARSCKRLQLEKQLLNQKLELENKTKESKIQQKRRRNEKAVKNDSERNPRRSSRFQ